jgi:hypothetical protein
MVKSCVGRGYIHVLVSILVRFPFILICAPVQLNNPIIEFVNLYLVVKSCDLFTLVDLFF